MRQPRRTGRRCQRAPARVTLGYSSSSVPLCVFGARVRACAALYLLTLCSAHGALLKREFRADLQQPVPMLVLLRKGEAAGGFGPPWDGRW